MRMFNVVSRMTGTTRWTVKDLLNSHEIAIRRHEAMRMVPTLKHIACPVGKDIWPAALLCLGILAASAASAEVACVQCSGPEQLYRCEITADHAIPDQAVGMFCVSRIASEHAHESCGAQRAATVCGGVSVSYVYDENTGPSDASATNPQGRTENDEPETLTEFTKDTVNASAQSAKNAGDNIGNAASKAGTATTDAIKGAGNAIGNATKKTLKCLGSALNDC
jgi:hypothetical protein